MIKKKTNATLKMLLMSSLDAEQILSWRYCYLSFPYFSVPISLSEWFVVFVFIYRFIDLFYFPAASDANNQKGNLSISFFSEIYILKTKKQKKTDLTLNFPPFLSANFHLGLLSYVKSLKRNQTAAGEPQNWFFHGILAWC